MFTGIAPFPAPTSSRKHARIPTDKPPLSARTIRMKTWAMSLLTSSPTKYVASCDLSPSLPSQ
ncbi:hypothetical protein BJ165DRAFT_1419530 [Panaeolus papilionaceus]|nr:hypothetical protein BJ165DRAFT_1419530 [Panaeolus papilionaceus]